MLATTASPCSRAMRMSCKCPWCRLPIVGTNATFPALSRCACNSAAVLKTRMTTAGVSDAMLRAREAAVLHRFDVGSHGCFDAVLAGHEVADEPCRLARVDAQHIV